MFGKVFRSGFWRTDLNLDPFTTEPKVSLDIDQTLARLLGFDYAGEQFRLVRVDADGRLLISSSETNTTSAQNSQATVTELGATLLSANPSRRQYIIQNLGDDPIYLNFGGTSDTTIDLQLPSNGIFIDDIYLGVVSALVEAGISCDVRIVEY